MSKKQTLFESVTETIEKMLPQFQSALPDQVDPKRFIRVARTCLRENPELLNCDHTSLFAALMKCAQDGLLPDGREAAIVKYRRKEGKPKAEYMAMMAGILKKVRNSGELKALSANVVYENDEFTYWTDEQGEHLKHMPLLSGDRGKVTHVFAIANTKDSGVYICVMTKEDVEKVRSVSRAKTGGPWSSWWGEMAKKSAIRRLSKILPMSTDLDTVIRRDDDHYELEPSEETTDVTAGNGGEKPKKASRASQVVEKATKDKEKEEKKDEPKEEQPEEKKEEEAEEGEAVPI